VHTRRLLAAPLAVLLTIAAATSVSAEFSVGYRFGGAYSGLKGTQGIRTDPPTVVGIGYVHITQLDTGAAGGDFVAIGTANGLGVDNCADDYDARWTGYYDGVAGGIYFCEDFAPDAWGAGASVSFAIEFKACPATGLNRWVLTLGGVVRGCVNASGTSGPQINVGIETTGGSSTDRNIDARYTSLMRKSPGANWVNWGSAAGTGFIVDLSYAADWVSETAIDTYLPPLN